MNLISNFNDFCFYVCDGLYDPQFNIEDQCTGYKQLKKMVIEGIEPASIEEIHRWETSPTVAELLNEPEIKYLRFLHANLRPLIVEKWDVIKNFHIEDKN